MTKIFKVPFATQGDRTAVPDEIQADGSLSYTQGYGYDYERDQVTDPAAKDIEREKMNGLFHDITEAVGEIQAFGVPVWAEEGKPYAVRSIVYHDKKVWQSKIENNETEPAEGDDWAELKADMTAEDVGAQAAGYSHSKAESDDKYQPKGNYASAGDLQKYLAKDQNGADIQNKDTFIKNLGLKELFLALTGGTLTGPLFIRQDGPALVISPTTEGGACYAQGRDHNNKAVWFIGNPTDGGTAIYFRNYITGSEVSLHAEGISLNRNTYINGTLGLANYSTFDARYSKIRTVLKSDNGYEKDENTGLIRQWGKTPAFGAGNGSPVRFPIPFPSKCVGVSALPIRDGASSAGSAETIYCGAPGLSGVQLFLGGTINYPVYWEAWGY